MSKTRPFTSKKLLEYPAFAVLPPQLQECALDLMERDQFNDTGNLKRSSNSFFMFRRVRSAQIISEHKLTPGWNPSKRLPQKDISLQLRAEWDNMSKEEKEVYGMQARGADDALHAFFPNYEYTPISSSWWNALNKEGKKRFFFESIVRICKALVYPDYKWPGYLGIQQWAQNPENSQYVNQAGLIKALQSAEKPVATAGRSARGSGIQSTPTRPHQVTSHPYNVARGKEPQVDQQVSSWLAKLKSELVFLGPRAPRGPDRMLELLPVCSHGAPFPVYVEVEIPLGTPQCVVEIMRHADSSIPQNSLILRDYTKPKGTVASLHPQLTPPHLANLSIPQDSYLTYSPSASSSASSSSSVSSNFSPITPEQPEPLYANGGFNMNYWNQFSNNFGVRSQYSSTVVPVMAVPAESQFGPVSQPHPCLPKTQSVAADAGTSLEIPQQNGITSSLVVQSTSSYDDNSSQPQLAGTDPWFSTFEPLQNDPQQQLTSLDPELNLFFNCTDRLSEEEHDLALDYFDSIFGAPAVSQTL
ncbi:hypothetical protein OPQ81_011333 [Rhizoctonia solani]|nr:hypothetical protein OPQ81_011333 [Rhizoctonia solani]